MKAVKQLFNKNGLLFIAFLFFSYGFKAQTIAKPLAIKLEQSLKDFKGSVGVYVHHLKTNTGYWYNADTSFPTASIVKIPIMMGVIKKIEEDSLQYHQKCIYKDSLLYEGEDILGAFKNNEPIELSKLLMLMMTTSDNTASLWLQSLAGTGTAINNWLDSNKFYNTKVNSRTPGREAARKTFGWGQTTPKEMAKILLSIYNKKLGSAEACDRMLRLLKRQYWDGEGLSALPPEVNVFTKNGAVNGSRSEVILAMTASGPLLISIFTKDIKDQSWNYENEAWQLTRKLIYTIYKYYNPKDKYVPRLKNGFNSLSIK
jgi:beta-lactamase class A